MKSKLNGKHGLMLIIFIRSWFSLPNNILFCCWNSSKSAPLYHYKTSFSLYISINLCCRIFLYLPQFVSFVLFAILQQHLLLFYCIMAAPFCCYFCCIIAAILLKLCCYMWVVFVCMWCWINAKIILRLLLMVCWFWNL